MTNKEQLFNEHPEQFMLKCGVCGKEFLPSSYKQYDNLTKKARKYNRKFYCSNECKRIEKGSVKVTCETCGKEFFINKYDKEHRENHFCSRECWKTYTKTNKNEKSLSGKIGKCLFCGKEYVINKSSTGKFCCFECSVEYKLKQTDKLIECGKNVTHRILKTYFLRHYNKCMNPECKWNWDGDNNPILELHHKDGNHNNNTLDNCLLLCPNCHSLTDNYKFKNGHLSSRKYRKKYYNK